MWGELELSAKPYPTGLSPLPALRSPGLDQLPFELSKAAEDDEHQSAMRGGCVAPRIRQ